MRRSFSRIEPAAHAPASEAPSGRVGRLSLVSGNVSVRASEKWLDAEVNFPLTAGASVRTGSQAQAEVDIGGNTIEIGPESEIEITKLNDRAIQVAVVRGRIGFDLRRRGDGETSRSTFQANTSRCCSPGITKSMPVADVLRSRQKARDPILTRRVLRQPIRFTVHDRLCRTRCRGNLGEHGRIRRCVGPGWATHRLGPLSRWSLALDCALGLDLDRQSTLGVRHVHYGRWAFVTSTGAGFQAPSGRVPSMPRPWSPSSAPPG